MTQEQFIKEIAKYVQKYAPQYGIEVCSPIIAQACLESQYGNSELAVFAHNYHGLKYRAGRCPTASGIYYKVGSEQDPITGKYTSSAMQWMKFDNMEKGVQGYFDFINISNYRDLKGIKDPYLYLQTIKNCKYATSINYVSNVYKVITKWNLTQYDNISNESNEDKLNNIGGNKMKISIHAGHNPDGKTACGAIGLIKESTEARLVKDKVIEMLKSQGHTVYDDTVDNGTSSSDVLKKIVTKVNSHDVDLAVSIHFNAGANKILNKATTGTEVFIYSSASKAKTYAQKVVNEISALGFKNRGVKTSTSLYVLRKTDVPSMLIECCFVDDPDDVELYNANKMAQAIVKGITGVAPSISTTLANNSIPTNKLYKVQTGAYSIEKNAIELQKKLHKKGFSTIIKKVDNLYKVQVGAYSKKENADAMLKKLKSKGFNGFITNE